MKKYPKMKSSGVEWIGDVPEHWGIARYKYFYRSGMGETILKENLIEEGSIPVFSATEEDEIFGFVDTPKLLLREGDFVIPARGNSIGHIMEVQEKCTCTQTTIYSKKTSQEIQTRFTFHFLKGLKPHLFQFDRTAIPQITVQQVGNNPFLLPSPTEQTAIAHYLDRKTAQIDQAISEKERLIELFREERQAIINHAVTKGIRAGVKMKASGVDWIGDVPEAWEVKKLKYVASLKSGESIVSDQILKEAPFPVFGGNGLRGYFTDYTHEGRYVLIGRQGALCGNINYANGKFWASEHAVVVSIKDGSDTFWLGELLRTMNLNQYSLASAQPGLSVEKIQNLHIPVPPLNEQVEISHFFQTKTAQIDTAISGIQQEIALLQEYRQALIFEAVTGKVDVRQNT